MNLNDAQTLAELHMEAYGLFNQDVPWRFKFDRASRRFGSCRVTRDGRKTITLSAALTELNDELTVEQVILHEVAHAIVGVRHGHDFYWQQKAREIGYNGQRCYDNSVVTPTKLGQAPYVFVCDNCGTKIPRFKRTRKELSCAVCAPQFDPRYLLRLVHNAPTR